ncbi:hypothetical protein IV203_034368 [Nitzschia inconspicua]|uniref:Uncharacterized protein n=1 Tax=Nitzschia inconspicua TaxID=303405 RepID=A0A9K3P8A4_9STRA|nr:hypothetical protein IV203_022841 [Nitzschia inconspicua]KAG7373644.1 hypothetical protein IV203_034368 [Nitzschia inconspicua]
MEQTTEESNQSLRQLLSLERERSLLKDELSLLKDELSALERSFSDGRYFAPLFDYWRVAGQTIEKNQVLSDIRWTNFWRTAEEADSIQVRQYSKQKKSDSPHPYTDTRMGAKDTSASTVASGSTSRTSQSSQNSPQKPRDMVWPRDIFGNDLNVGQDIAYLLPAGQIHKEWIHIAASVVGLYKDAYSALFAAGMPNKSGSKEDTDVPSHYRAVGLISPDAVYNGKIRDASAIEIEKAKGTLIHAVLAPNAYYRSLMKRTKIESLSFLVEFGSVGDEDKHPAPDPLLLVYKAAAIWGMVTKKRLVSNGEAQDPSADISEGDYLAELAFLEARSGFKRPQTWEALAIGLGQPNGYQASRQKVS